VAFGAFGAKPRSVNGPDGSLAALDHALTLPNVGAFGNLRDECSVRNERT
jgi:hypothetical protein